MHLKVMEIALLIMENHGKIMDFFFFNFYGNPEPCSYKSIQVSI